MPLPFLPSARGARPLALVTAAALRAWRRTLPAAQNRWLDASGFAGKPGDLALLAPGGRGGGGAVAVIAGDGSNADFWRMAGLATRLPEGGWRLDAASAPGIGLRACIAWGLGSYRFDRYRKPSRAPARLVWPAGVDRAHVTRTVEAAWFGRDLINTPAEDLGPAELAAAAVEMAGKLGMKHRVTVGEALLGEGHRLIHAVGRASARAPRLIDLTWGDPHAPKVTLVGKGVCFDSGGLDLKTADGMKFMKKDMGGAAHVLALAQVIVRAKLPVRLRVLVPAVENFVAANSFRPMDVIRSRKGITVEIGNTDAEGRLILADAIDLACAESPDLLIDMATLTGAARVALGPELPATFCNDEGLWAEVAHRAALEADPLWRMPLWRPYRAQLDSRVADINNTGGPMAGSVTAAVFLQDFVAPGIKWLHLDLFAWNAAARPGRPEGAEIQAIRGLYEVIVARLGGTPN